MCCSCLSAHVPASIPLARNLSAKSSNMAPAVSFWRSRGMPFAVAWNAPSIRMPMTIYQSASPSAMVRMN